MHGQSHPGHEDDILAGCDAVDKLVWLSAVCDRFSNDISHCTTEQFSKYQNSLLELEPVERALNSWIDGLRRDDFKEKKCAEELQRTIALMSHLAEIHISEGLPSFADDVHMSSLVVQSYLDSATVSFNTTRAMVQRVIIAEGEDDEMSQLLAKKFDTAITQTRSAKVMAGKAVRALEDLKTRSLSLLPHTKPLFEQSEQSSRELASLARGIGNHIHSLLTQDEGRADPFTYGEIQNAIHQAVMEATSAPESDTFSTYLAKLHIAAGQISDVAALATDLDQTQEFDVHPAPWKLRSQELKALKTVPVDIEEELRRLKEEHNEGRRTIAQRDEHLSTATLKIETLESRMRDAQANIDRITSLRKQLEASGEQVVNLKEDIEKQDRELKNLESERDKWKKIASDSRAFADGADAAGMKAGQERAVATAREMDALKKDIEGLQSAVRYLREDNRRARTTEQDKHEWLAEPLTKSASAAEQRKALVVAEGKDVLGELVKMATTSKVFDFGTLPKDKLSWKPAKLTPRYHAAKQMEDFAAWDNWRSAVVKKSSMLRTADVGMTRLRNPAAQLQIRLPGPDGKMKSGRPWARDIQVVGSREWEALQSSRIAI
jgi:dynactin 1